MENQCSTLKVKKYGCNVEAKRKLLYFLPYKVVVVTTKKAINI